MSGDAAIREKLETLRKHMYEELNKLKNHMLEEKNYENGMILIKGIGHTVHNGGVDRTASILLKHRKAHRRVDSRYRRYRA